MTVDATTVFAWLGNPTTPTADQLATMQTVVDAVTVNINRTHTAPVATDPPVDPDPNLADWELGITMQCARFWKRKSSPEGVISASDLGIIRVSRFDSDIETMLTPFLNFVMA